MFLSVWSSRGLSWGFHAVLAAAGRRFGWLLPAALVACSGGQGEAGTAGTAASAVAASGPSASAQAVTDRTACASEGQRCAFVGTAPVRRGIDPRSAGSRQVGTNLGGVSYYSGNFPFADLMRNSGGWSPRNADGSEGGRFPSSAADGTPTALAAGQRAVAAVAWDGNRQPLGRYTVLWDGDGTLGFPMSALRVVERAAHRIVVDWAGGGGPMWVSIDTTHPADPVRNVRFLLPGTEASHAAQPFNPDYLRRIAPFRTLRFMDWGGTNGSTVREWADRARIGVGTVSYATAQGVPLEVMIDLANALRADPWFCIPHQASDDYVRQFATLLHARLDPALKAHVEYSNEVWNAGFEQTRWALAQSEAQGLDRPGGQPSIFYARRAVQMFKIMRQVYGADSGRLVRVLAGQAAWTQFLESALAYADTASQVDAIAIAPYYHAADAADVARIDATLALPPGRIVDQMLANVRGEVKNWMTANGALAARYRLPLKAYESGASNVSSHFPADRRQAVYEAFAAAQRHPRMKALVAEYHAQWKAAGGEAMLQYYDIGGWSIHGLWGALESIGQEPADSPIYQGLLSAIEAGPTTPTTATATTATSTAPGRTGGSR